MTINQQLHNSATHAKGNDPNCPVCAAPAKIQAGQTIDPELARQTFEGLVRAAMVDNRVILGNVEFWIDPDGPWKDQLSFSIPSNQWDVLAIQRDLITSMYTADEPPTVDDSVKCCPDCERPNQFGELCPECAREQGVQRG